MTRPRHGWLLEQLPTLFAEPVTPDDPNVTYLDMEAFMRIFEDVANSIEDEVDGLDRYLDPDVAPLPFVRWMGRWLGIDISPTMTADQQKRLLAAAGEALTWRSTATGLRMLLEAFTGAEVTIEDSGGVLTPGDNLPRRNHVTVRMTGSGDLVNEQLFRLIRDEIPADAALTLDVAGNITDGEDDLDADRPFDGDGDKGTVGDPDEETAGDPEEEARP